MKQRLIDANKLLEELRESCRQYAENGGEFSLWQRDIRIVHEQPTIEAEPVRHGKWIDIDEQTYTWKVRCSCCCNERSMMSTQGKHPNYCEECGARLDEE